MTRAVRTHLLTDTQSPATLVPKHLTKQEFGRRLYSMMIGRGWTQSELARQSGLQRDSVSTYVRGKSLPTPLNLEALAKAFGVTPEEMLPNQIESAIDEDNPSFEMKVSVGAPGTAWVRVNRLVSMTTAVKIAEMLDADQATEKRSA